MKLAVLRIGPVDNSVVKSMQENLSSIFPEVTCRVVKYVMPIPQDAYNQARRQHNSTKILTRIDGHVEDLDVDRVLGITDADLYVPRLNFVFGEAECPGKIAIISLYRLRPEFYGRPLDRKLFVERCVKEAVHEVGHTLGLPHCRDSSCVMFFSNSILDTDRKKASFCDRCYRSVMKCLESL